MDLSTDVHTKARRVGTEPKHMDTADAELYDDMIIALGRLSSLMQAMMHNEWHALEEEKNGHRWNLLAIADDICGQTTRQIDQTVAASLKRGLAAAGHYIEPNTGAGA